jgi:predicted DNA-binding transcriptional regulator YafY
LVGDVLRYGRDCEVVSPEDLREAVAGEVRAMAGVYSVG